MRSNLFGHQVWMIVRRGWRAVPDLGGFRGLPIMPYRRLGRLTPPPRLNSFVQACDFGWVLLPGWAVSSPICSGAVPPVLGEPTRPIAIQVADIGTVTATLLGANDRNPMHPAIHLGWITKIEPQRTKEFGKISGGVSGAHGAALLRL